MDTRSISRTNTALASQQVDLEHRQKEAQLQLALESARMGFWDWNLETGAVTRSANLVQMYGWQPEQCNAECDVFLASVHPDDRAVLQQAEQHSIKTGKDCDVEFRIVLPDGTCRWMESKARVIYNDAGRPLRMTGISLDISDRKGAEAQTKTSLQEKEVLLQELHHRVKNNLQIISSILDLQSQVADSPATQQILGDCRNRVKSMALVHELLYKTNNLTQVNAADYLRLLIQRLVEAYTANADRIQLELELDDVVLNVDRLLPCGMIVSELVTNALKHGLPPSDGRNLRVSLACQEKKTAVLSVKNSGNSLPSDFNARKTQSLGLQLVDILAEQLGGIIEVCNDSLLEFRLQFPVGSESVLQNA